MDGQMSAEFKTTAVRQRWQSNEKLNEYSGCKGILEEGWNAREDNDSLVLGAV